MVKNLPANAGDVGSIPGLGRFSGEGNGNSLQHSCLENSMDRGAWRATVHGIARVRRDLVTKQQQITVSNIKIRTLGLELEKAVAPHSSTLAWRIPWTEEPGGLQSMGSLSRTRLSDFTFTFHFPALEKEMATHSSVLDWRIPGKGSLMGCRLWGHTETATTEAT